MNIRFSEDQSAALRVQAQKEGRSMQQVVTDAVQDYLFRQADDEQTDALASEGAARFKDLLDRLGS